MPTALLRPLVLAVICFAIGFGLPAAAEDTLSPAQKEAVERLIHDYLLKNPEIIVEAITELERRQTEQSRTATQAGIQKHRDAIFADGRDFVLNPDGKVPVVEFFDYQCAYCKRLYPALADLMRSQDDVRLIYKEFPILSDVSVFAAKAAIAARSQGKYVALHDALMASRGQLTEAAVLDMAEDVGLDLETLKHDMEAPAVMETIQANHALADALNIRGTPTLIIGDTLIPGAVDYERLLAEVEETRKSCSVC